jgi:hypothetical protein
MKFAVSFGGERFRWKDGQCRIEREIQFLVFCEVNQHWLKVGPFQNLVGQVSFQFQEDDRKRFGVRILNFNSLQREERLLKFDFVTSIGSPFRADRNIWKISEETREVTEY